MCMTNEYTLLKLIFIAQVYKFMQKCMYGKPCVYSSDMANIDPQLIKLLAEVLTYIYVYIGTRNSFPCTCTSIVIPYLAYIHIL